VSQRFGDLCCPQNYVAYGFWSACLRAERALWGRRQFRSLSALARKFADVFVLGGLGGGPVELLGEAVEVGAGELPLERLGDLFVAAAERE
jgi:hypothetical protein